MHSSSVIFEKTAHNEREAARLAHEASILRLAVHPNVVELAAPQDDESGESLSTARVNGTPLCDANLDLQTFGSVIMSAAATLGYLHELGIAHSRVDASHLIVREGRRTFASGNQRLAGPRWVNDNTAVLCGFGEATLDAPDDAKLRDVSALGALLRNHLDEAHDTLRSRINGVVSADASLAATLSSLAEVAIQGEMPAQRFAEDLRRALERVPLQQPGKHYRHRSRQWTVALALIVPTALAGIGITALSGTRTSATAIPTTNKVSLCRGAAQQGALAIDTDDDGCPNAIVLGPNVLTIDGERYAAGNPEDRLLVGVWQPQGPATLALLRPSTGQVFVFKQWPAINQSATPVLVGTVPGATAIANRHESEHDLIEVTTPDGQTTIDPAGPTS